MFECERVAGGDRLSHFLLADISLAIDIALQHCIRNPAARSLARKAVTSFTSSASLLNRQTLPRRDTAHRPACLPDRTWKASPLASATSIKHPKFTMVSWPA